MELVQQPLILTLKLDEKSAAYFTDLRTKYFPPERNYLDAHLTLFHHLPAGNQQIIDTIKTACKDQKKFKLDVNQIVSIGAGVAFKVESGALSNLHKKLQQHWQPFLIAQDKQKLWPHITIQNKVNHQLASQLKQQLETDFKPFEIEALGFNLYEYLNGPWRFLNFFEFK